MSDPLIFISVVRDLRMYERCLQNNPNVNLHRLVRCDNSIENKGIPVRYNEFLNGYDFNNPAWFIFCHEDFEPLENFSPKLEGLDPNKLYGPIGTLTKVYFGLFYKWRLIGTIIGSSRSGMNTNRLGTPAPTGTPVETFDCQCLLVHSSLIKRTGLRFDENLLFDLYLEDFCIQANENFSIGSYIFSFACHHWSDSLATPRYQEQEKYLNRKYPCCCYTGSCSFDIGHPNLIRRLNTLLKKTIFFLLSLTKPRDLRSGTNSHIKAPMEHDK